MRSLLFLSLLGLASLPAFSAGAEKNKAPAEPAIEIVPLDSDFPVHRMLQPNVFLRPQVVPVGKNGPLPLRIQEEIGASVKLELPKKWDALERDLFFGRVEFGEEADMRSRYGSLFSEEQLTSLREKLRARRAAELSGKGRS